MLGPQPQSAPAPLPMGPHPLLSRACRILRRTRPLLPDDFRFGVWTDPGGPERYAYLYFRTGGCCFSRAGECTLCDYWAARAPTPDAMVAAVEAALASLPATLDVFQVNGLGSLFDPREVPPEARRAILERVASRDVGLFIVETRPETVTPALVEELIQVRPGHRLGLELGVESASPWVRRFCLNKTASAEAALTLAREADLEAFVNVLLGAPFLDEAEAEADAIASVLHLQAQGAGRCVVFPAHVKPHTLAHWLWQRKQYRGPSLWSLARVLARLDHAGARPLISWYRPQYTALETALGRGSVAVPDTCPQCRDAVLALFDAYRHHEDAGVLASLSAYPCSCRPTHAERAPLALEERIRQGYEGIGTHLIPAEWPALRDASLRGIEAVPEHLRALERIPKSGNRFSDKMRVKTKS